MDVLLEAEGLASCENDRVLRAITDKLFCQIDRINIYLTRPLECKDYNDLCNVKEELVELKNDLYSHLIYLYEKFPIVKVIDDRFGFCNFSKKGDFHVR